MDGRSGFSVLASGLIVVAIGTLWYWPDVLKALGKNIAIVYNTNAKRVQPPAAAYGVSVPAVEVANYYRVFLYFGLTFRLHFVTLVGAATVWLLWPLKWRRHLTERMRAAIFLSVLLLVLLAAHMQASLFGDFCVSCILLYVGYFDFIGFLLLVVAHRFLLRNLSAVRRTFVLAIGAITIVSIGSTTHEDLSSDFAKAMIERLDRVYLWNALLNITGLPHLMCSGLHL